jgi:hypothetical protein
MEPNLILGAFGSVVIVATLVELLRRRQMRGKFAILWILVALMSLVLTLFPRVLFASADLLGVEVASNLLFFIAILLLLFASIQHSYEVGKLEERTRILAEEVALLDLKVRSGSSCDCAKPKD